MSGHQTLVIDPPAVLKFKGPQNAAQTVDLKLYNPSDNVVLFKIKTTAPKRYCVRPNSGSASPRSNVTVSITFQPSSNEAENDRTKHKFMVQSVIVPADTAAENQDQLWKETTPGETRLKCIYEGDPTEVENGSLPSKQEVNGANSANTETNAGASAIPDDIINNLNGMSSNRDLPPAGSTDATTENQQLRTRISQLSDECARLRENELRLRRMATPAGEKRSPPQHAPSSTVESPQPSMNMQMLLSIAFVALFIGIVIGKFVF